MTRTQELFQAKENLLCAFLVLGDPHPKEFVDLALACLDSGVDMLEIGLPFSEPTADGPTIQKAHARALSHRLSFSRELELIKTLRRQTQAPLGILTYVQRLHAVGYQNFLRSLDQAGIDNILVADSPFDADSQLTELLTQSPLDNIGLLAPHTSLARLKSIENHSSGYLYGVSLLGVTGARDHLASGQKSCIRRWNRQAHLPMMVGFGLSTPNQLKDVYNCGAQAAVVGSAGVKCLEAPTAAQRAQQIKTLFSRLARAKNFRRS